MHIFILMFFITLCGSLSQGFSQIHSSHPSIPQWGQNHPPQQTQLHKNLLLKKKNHLHLINYLISKNNYTSYLEIGIADGSNFCNVLAQHKIGVDPSSSTPATHRMTSDAFFQTNQESFDLIFIDGLHLSEQALKDVENALNCLTPNGIIVMHDCKPEQIEHQYRTPVLGAWTGDVWKTAAYIRMHYDHVHFCVLDMDWGCGILTPHSSQTLFPETSMEDLDWDFYLANRKEMLNIVSLETWLDISLRGN